MVVDLDNDSYLAEVNRHLSDERFYRKLDSNPQMNF